MTEILRCINPDQIQESDYLADLNNDARPEFEAHLQACQYCRAEVAAFGKLDSLMHKNYGFIVAPERILCTETIKLGEYLLGLLDEIGQRNLKAHLTACQYCTEELTNLKRFMPEEPISFVPRRPSTTPQINFGDIKDWLHRVVATVLTATQPQVGMATAGAVRSTTMIPTMLDGTPQIFEAEDVQVTITVQSAAKRTTDVKIEGLVQRENYGQDELEGSEIRLIKDNDELVATVKIDDSGNFVFERIARSQIFTMEITLNDKLIIIPGIKAN